ncbi:MAG: uroporphyrinogen decarboxylase [Planctomycetia bacterium]|nr:uroporphyrinogen decarboxylase [Planctomycetia bacterium]
MISNQNVASYENSLIMRTIRREPIERTPVWLMRQAGRYMAEYRAVREKTSFLELCKNPQLCAEVMQTAVEKIGVDAAIIFSDLLLILEPMGFELDFLSSNAPVIHGRFENENDLDRIIELDDLSALDFVFETVQETRKHIDASKPIIGFAGAPFTLASYAIEGGSSRTFERTKTLMYSNPSVWNELMGRISRSVARYLNEQIRSGAQIVQLFDSWVGCLSVEDYHRFVYPHTKSLIEMIQPGAPVIHFGTGNPSLLEEFADAGGDIIGVDWRIPIDVAWNRIGIQRSIQGNLDPAVLLTNPDIIRRESHRILKLVAGRPGFIFNLGHGILRQTPVENVIALVEAVHDFKFKPS